MVLPHNSGAPAVFLKPMLSVQTLVGQVGVEPTNPKDLIYSQVRLSDSAAGPHSGRKDVNRTHNLQCIRLAL